MRLALRTATAGGPTDGVTGHICAEGGGCPGSGGVATGGGIVEKYGGCGPGMAAARGGGRRRAISPRKFLQATIADQAKNPAPAIARPRNTRVRRRRDASPPKASEPNAAA